MGKGQRDGEKGKLLAMRETEPSPATAAPAPEERPSSDCTAK